MVHISGAAYAFAALRADGSVVTWGNSDWGGDSSSVDHLLRDTRALPAVDTDTDGLSNANEWANCRTPYPSDAASLGHSPCLNASNRDTDGDGVWDNREIVYGTEPRKRRYQDSMMDLDLNSAPDFWFLPSS